jgi:hypothetical protein
VRLYLDASLLVAAALADALTPRARALLAERSDQIVSDIAVAVFSSAVGRKVRMRRNSVDEGRLAFARLDEWIARSCVVVTVDHRDIGATTAILRRPDLNLRTGDAFNIAIAQRVGAALATFDRSMAEIARALGAAVAAA